MTTQTEYKKYRIYGIVGMVTLFLMGAIVGFILNGSDRINHSIMTQEQCERLSDKMWTAINNNRYEEIGQLNKIYSENCLDRVFEEPKPQPKVEEQEIPETTCGKIEMLLTQRLNPVDDQNVEAHTENAKIYTYLVDRGCPENSEKYKKLENEENRIAEALKGENAPVEPCKRLERVLISELKCVDGYEICGDPNLHINNAKIYANLVERGCRQNQGRYRDLAKQELEIARALNDDNVRNEYQTTEVVEIYKRLHMQAEAERIIEKAKKLTNPAIDFIIQLEKIIEED